MIYGNTICSEDGPGRSVVCDEAAGGKSLAAGSFRPPKGAKFEGAWWVKACCSYRSFASQSL